MPAALKQKILDMVCRPKSAPIFILGNQKSGTTVIAKSLASALGATYSHDMFSARGWTDTDALHKGNLSVADLIRRGPYEFSRDVIKEPDLTFVLSDLMAAFPKGKYIFVLRSPANNIRSILNRLNAPGHLDDLPKEEFPDLKNNKLWQNVFCTKPLGLSDGNYVDILAQRWAQAAKEFSAHQQALIRIDYANFLRDKVGGIKMLCESLGCKLVNDISSTVDVQYQSKGDHGIDVEKFFGSNNLNRIRVHCQSKADRLRIPLIQK